MKFRYAAASVAPGKKREEPEDSMEQLYHPDLGWSPKWPRMPTFDQFRDAMEKWSSKIRVHRQGNTATAYYGVNPLCAVRFRTTESE